LYRIFGAGNTRIAREKNGIAKSLQGKPIADGVEIMCAENNTCSFVDNTTHKTMGVSVQFCNMQLGRTIFKILTNRYLLATAAFAVWMLVFDKNDLYSRLQRTRELDEMNSRIEFYRKGISEAKKELSALQNDPAALEQYAREQYYMRRPNEHIFVMPPTGHDSLDINLVKTNN
jgi:cell division protein FtsB